MLTALSGIVEVTVNTPLKGGNFLDFHGRRIAQFHSYPSVSKGHDLASRDFEKFTEED